MADDPIYGYRRRRNDLPPLVQDPETKTERIGGPLRLEAQKVHRIVQDVDDVTELLESIFSADSLLFNYALYVSTRGSTNPGKWWNPTIDGADASTFARDQFPHVHAVKWPLYEFGVATNTAAAKRIGLREEDAMLLTLAHGTAPTGMTGFGPLLAIFDYWLAPKRRDLFAAKPESWFGLCEERVTATATLPSSSSYGALVGVTCGPTGNWFAQHRKDSGGSYVETDLGVAPVNDEFHRWTWLVRNRLANGGAGIAELYYDTIKVFEVPVADLPAAAMFIAGGVGCPTDAESNDKGFAVGILQAYQTRAVGFKPWD